MLVTKTGLGGISMCLDKIKVRIQRPWPFVTDVTDMSGYLKCSGRALDMQPWPKPFSPRQTWHPSKGLRVRGKRSRATTCER